MYTGETMAMRDLFFSALEATLSAARYHLEGHDALALSALEQAEASIKAIQGELLSVKTTPIDDGTTRDYTSLLKAVRHWEKEHNK